MREEDYEGMSEDNQKENQALRANYYNQRSNKKFTYAHFQQPKLNRNQSLASSSQNIVQNEEIRELRQALHEQRKKVKFLESKTIQQQLNVLENLEMLQSKFQCIAQQKQRIENDYKKLKNQGDWRTKYECLMQEHKKVKGIADSLVDMMSKVEGQEGDVHQAWRWVKRVVWQHQAIKKKAFEWKQVYDQVTQSVQKMDKESLNTK